MEIDKLEDRELDAAVAEQLGLHCIYVRPNEGWTVPAYNDWYYEDDRPWGKKLTLVPGFSGNTFHRVKREIERRGWSWMSVGSARPEPSYQFAIWDSVRISSDGKQHTPFAPELGRVFARSEELAGCRAFLKACGKE